MASVTKIKSNGTWIEPKDIWVKTNNVWVKSKQIFIKQNDTWVQVFPPYVPGSITYEEVGTYTWVVPRGVRQVNYVIIGGGAGGAGGSDADPYTTGGGGGGAGALVTGTLAVEPNQSVICKVGAGGNGGSAFGNGKDGKSSSVDSIVAPGGGAPRSYASGHYPYGGYSGNDNSHDGGNGGIAKGEHDRDGGNGGGVPGYSAGGSVHPYNTGHAGTAPGGGGAGGTGVSFDGSTGGGDGAKGRVYLTW